MSGFNTNESEDDRAHEEPKDMHPRGNIRRTTVESTLSPVICAARKGLT